MGVPRQIVVDTNVLVSGLFTKKGSPPTELVALFLTGFLHVCYDARIMTEYRRIFARPKLDLDLQQRARLLQIIEAEGFDVDPFPVDLDFPDQSDRPFYEVAKLCFCPLVTGNKKHFPREDWIFTPAEYLEALW